jgi:hypothetical protein
MERIATVNYSVEPNYLGERAKNSMKKHERNQQLTSPMTL